MFPTLALVRELMRRGHETMIITDERGLSFVDKALKVAEIPSTAFFGRSLGDKLRAVGNYFAGKRMCLDFIEEFQPSAVVGTGGYASFPLLQAAVAKKVPIFLVEQNSVPGRVTRILASRAREIYCGIPLTSRLKGKVVVTGNPLRKSVILDEPEKGKEILVLGGSGGARILNEFGYELAKRIRRERFVILTGKRDFADMKAKPQLENLELVEFTEHPEELYKRAKLALSRAGAIALSELLVNGIPSVLVPFPYAVDDHQTANARWAETAGAAIMIPQKDLARVEEVLHALLGDEKHRNRMAQAGRQLVPQDAAQRIAERMERCLAA